MGTSELSIVDAAKQRDVAAIRAIIGRGGDVNVPVGDTNALHWAVRHDDLEVVDVLLDAGARPNVANDFGVTPLSLACTNGDPTMVARLLEAGSDPNATQVTGETVLMTCARFSDPLSVRFLLTAGADPNSREHLQHQTALIWAVAAGRAESVRMLLESSADISARTLVQTEYIRDPAGRPRRGGPVPTLPYPIGGFTPLLFAARHGALDSARLLLDAGADVNDKAADGLSALVIATQANHADLAAFLLERGANPNAEDADYTALHAAILRANVELAKTLLASGADPNAVITRGNPARRFGYQWDIANSNIGATPFFLAAKFGEPAIMRVLAAAGGDPLRPQVADDDVAGDYVARVVSGTTPLMVAAGLGWYRPDDVGSGGADRRGRGLRRDEMFAEWEDEERWLATVEMALSFKLNVSATNASGDTAAHAAARLGLQSVVQLLVEHGASLDVTNKRGETPEVLLREFEKPRR